MDIARIDCLIKFILATSGQEDPGSNEVGPIHLIKYVYLADLIFAEKHRGETYTGAPWRFHHFGPWSPEVYSRIEPAITEVGARVRQIPSSKAEEDLIRYSLDDEALFNQLESELPFTLAVALKGLIHKFGDDTTSLLHYVYRTPPMLGAAPGETLSFKGETAEEEQPKVAGQVSDVVELYQTLSKTKRKAAMRNLKAQIQAKLAEKRLKKEKSRPPTPPRYDEVFFEGVKWLESLAGEPVQPEEGEITFSNSIWKSPARTVPDVS